MYVEVLCEPMEFLLSVNLGKAMGDHARQRKKGKEKGQEKGKEKERKSTGRDGKKERERKGRGKGKKVSVSHGPFLMSKVIVLLSFVNPVCMCVCSFFLAIIKKGV